MVPTVPSLPPSSLDSAQRGQPVYRRNKLPGLEAYEDLQMLDSSARLLSQMVDSLDDANDLKSQVFGELVEHLTGKKTELGQEAAGPNTGVRKTAVLSVLEEIVFVLQSHAEICAVFLPYNGGGRSGGGGSGGSNGGGNGGGGNNSASNQTGGGGLNHQMVDELTQQALARSLVEK
jgi:hypothetical protein